MATVMQLLLGLLVLGLAFVLTCALTLRWAWRRACRAVRRRRGLLLPALLPAGARPWVRATLPGSTLDVATLRRELRDDLRGAASAVEAGRRARRPVDGLSAVLPRLVEQARALDLDLRVVASEPDRARRRQLLAVQADRVRVLRVACAEVRRGVLLAGSATPAPLLPQLMEDVEDEVTALGLRARAYEELAAR